MKIATNLLTHFVTKAKSCFSSLSILAHNLISIFLIKHLSSKRSCIPTAILQFYTFNNKTLNLIYSENRYFDTQLEGLKKYEDYLRYTRAFRSSSSFLVDIINLTFNNKFDNYHSWCIYVKLSISEICRSDAMSIVLLMLPNVWRITEITEQISWNTFLSFDNDFLKSITALFWSTDRQKVLVRFYRFMYSKFGIRT